MKKIYLLLLVIVVIVSLVACKTETVLLCCDGGNCQNTVEVEIGKSGTPDESWVVFCQECADSVLED